MDISINDVRFSYEGASPVLDGITVDIRGPQVVSILGPNGVGKSTLMHCINKILSPSMGTVCYDGRDVSEYSLKDMAKHMGYVPCTSSDSFPLTVVDTVLLGRHPHAGWRTTDHDLEVVYETLEKLGIQDLAMRYFNELSAGQHQKVMLARGLVQQPDVLLLDEPTSNLDIRHQLGISRMLRRISHEDGLLVVMISHDLNIAARYSDNIILMSGGRIFAVGKPEDVLTPENIRTVYGVESEIVSVEGRPYIILLDDGCDDAPPCGDAVCMGAEAPLPGGVAVGSLRSRPILFHRSCSHGQESHLRSSRGGHHRCGLRRRLFRHVEGQRRERLALLPRRSRAEGVRQHQRG